MMKLFSSLALFAAVSICFALLHSPNAVAQKAMAEDCTMTVQETWFGDYTAEASTSGECGLGNYGLVVHNGKGEVIWNESYQNGNLFGFDEIYTPAEMKLALADWVGTYAQQSTSGTLPQWPAGADGPEAGEFPFYVEEGVTQPLYEEVRAEDRPMICYIQGRESLLCLLRHPETGALETVGFQSFPG